MSEFTVHTFKKISGILVTVFLFCLIASSVSYGQGRVTYRELANRNQQRNIYFDFFTLPGSEDGKVKFVTAFRVDYNFLPFKKADRSESDDGNAFYSPLGLSMEVFKAEKQVQKDDNIKVEGLESVSRTAWRDTAFAASYEQTQSNNSFISGLLNVDLEPGLYNYMLQLAPGEDTRERTSRARQVKINPYESQKVGNILLAESVSGEVDSRSLKLLNFGQNVYYGKDFYAFIHLPEYDEQSPYSIRINRLDIGKKDTTRKQEVFQQELTPEQLITNIKPSIKEESNALSLSLNVQSGTHTYALIKVPNSSFPNAVYRMEVFKEGQSQPKARGIFRSLWIEMPTSLLNLDVATEMLRFIVSKEELKRIRSGSESEREQKFRAFWKSKDPTPDTEFNELMAEYYRRIDYSYEHFSTINAIGYESDQGEVYIKYGPPNNIERKFPTGEAAVEIWTYNNRQFIFKATSGFGDFQLVSR